VLALGEAVGIAQVVRYVKGDGDAVVGEPVDLGDTQWMEHCVARRSRGRRGHQIGLK
jgi:hypothetical protein